MHLLHEWILLEERSSVSSKLHLVSNRDLFNDDNWNVSIEGAWIVGDSSWSRSSIVDSRLFITSLLLGLFCGVVFFLLIHIIPITTNNPINPIATNVNAITLQLEVEELWDILFFGISTVPNVVNSWEELSNEGDVMNDDTSNSLDTDAQCM